jgi:hypothetical protein
MFRFLRDEMTTGGALVSVFELLRATICLAKREIGRNPDTTIVNGITFSWQRA